MPYDVAAVRDRFPALKAGFAHFDGPGGSQVPDSVADAVARTLLSPLANRGTVTEPERDTVLGLARARGVEVGSPAYAQLLEWLRVRPADAIFDTALEVIKNGFAVLPPEEREERIKRIVQACHEVATASGGGLAKLLGLGSSVSSTEASILDTITSALRSHN